MYEKVLSRVPSGQFYDALSSVEQALGNSERAATLHKEALKTLRHDYEKMPNAMGGHALDIVLESGDPKWALELALQNHELRPGMEAKVKLAQAYLRNKQFEEAQKTFEPVLASRWSTVDSNLTAALLLEQKGESARASEYVAKAEALRPGSKDDLDWLITF